MTTRRIAVTDTQLPEIEALFLSLPDILLGRARDVNGLAAGFKAAIGYEWFSLVMVAFNAKGRGRVDSAGESWLSLSESYLAYVRPVTGRHPPRAGKWAPGDKDGYLTQDQKRLWNRTFAQALGHLLMEGNDEQDARSHAAAIAWIVVKAKGAKTKLGTFGQRKAGKDYQTLDDVGTLRKSLMVGEKTDTSYTHKPNQIYRDEGPRVILGSNAPTAVFHHFARDPRRRRRLWPKTIPGKWWKRINRAGIGALTRIAEMFGGAVG